MTICLESRVVPIVLTVKGQNEARAPCNAVHHHRRSSGLPRVVLGMCVHVIVKESAES